MITRRRGIQNLESYLSMNIATHEEPLSEWDIIEYSLFEITWKKNTELVDRKKLIILKNL